MLGRLDEYIVRPELPHAPQPLQAGGSRLPHGAVSAAKVAATAAPAGSMPAAAVTQSPQQQQRWQERPSSRPQPPPATRQQGMPSSLTGSFSPSANRFAALDGIANAEGSEQVGA